MAKRNASSRLKRIRDPIAAIAGGYEPGDNVLVQTRLPSAAVVELKEIAKREYSTVAAVAREMLLRHLGFLPATAAKETTP